MCVCQCGEYGEVNSVPSLDVAYCLAVVPASGQQSLFASAHAGVANSIDASNQGVSNGHRLLRKPSIPLLPVRDYLLVYRV